MEQNKLNPRVEINIDNAVQSFRGLKGNGVFSEQLFRDFFNHLRQSYSLYDELADVANLKETGTPNCWSLQDGVGYFTLTKFGFIDKTYQK